AITADTGGTAQNALAIGGSSATSFTSQYWKTSAGSTSTYIIAYGASHSSEAGNFAIKNENNGGKEIFFALNSSQPLRLSNTSATFAGNIVVAGTVDGIDIAARDAVLTSTTTTAGAALPKAGGTLTGNILFNDSVVARWGNSADLKIYHDGSNSYIEDSGTGNLKIRTNALNIMNAANNQSMISAAQGAAVILYYNNSAKLTTTNTGIDVTGAITTDGLTSAGTILATSSTTINTILRGGDGNSKNLIFQKTTGSAQQAKISAVGDDLRFTTGPTTERMRIDSSGNIGIGTSAPTSKVDIRSPNGVTHSRGQLYLTNTDTAAINKGSQISLGGTYSGTGDTYFASIAGRKENATSADYDGYLQFATRANGGSNVERMRITSSGNVGIGTNAPAALLHVKSAGNGEIEVERTSGALINLQAQAAAGYIGTDSNHLFGLKANGTVRLKISTGGAISFNDAFTFPTADGSANQLLKTDGSGNMSWVTVAGSGVPTYLADADNNTKIQVEES
ncbi:MAG: hypothetical protein ACKVJK_24245, partial [Methylophagaceae bacterium]